jgi:hypothetical protein
MNEEVMTRVGSQRHRIKAKKEKKNGIVERVGI